MIEATKVPGNSELMCRTEARWGVNVTKSRKVVEGRRGSRDHMNHSTGK